MMTKIYLICAAQNEGEPYRIAVGQEEMDITPRGRDEAFALAKHLSGETFAAVYSSDTYAARATAKLLCQPKRLQTSKALRELFLGSWEGRNWGNIAFDAPTQLHAFQNNLDSWQIEGSETIREVKERMCRELIKIAKAHDGQTVAVISHPIAIGLCLSMFGSSLDFSPQENASYSLLTWEKGTMRIVSQGNTAHLQEIPFPHYRKPDFNPLVCFFLLRYVEYSEMMADAVQMIWEEIGDERPFDRNILLNDANRLVTLVGHVEMLPAAFLQYGVMPGWITLLCVAPSCRNAGVGTQLIGQAVVDARMKGSDHLFIPLAKNNPHQEFFLRQDFHVMEELPDGRELFVKDICFAPEPA